MKRIAILAAVLVSLAAPVPAATDLAGTSWRLSSRESLTISGVGVDRTRQTGITLTFDDARRWTLVHPRSGTFTGTTRGRRRFRFKLDAASRADYRDFLVSIVLRETGGSSVRVDGACSSVSGTAGSPAKRSPTSRWLTCPRERSRATIS